MHAEKDKMYVYSIFVDTKCKKMKPGSKMRWEEETRGKKMKSEVPGGKRGENEEV